VVYVDNSRVGSATGTLHATTSSSGDTATYILYSTVYDDHNVKQMDTDNSLHWSTPSTWTEAGDVYAESRLHIIDAADWNAHGAMQYGDHRYRISMSDYTSSGSQVFYSYGEGGYDGDWNDW
jgi:hypothetical protein